MWDEVHLVSKNATFSRIVILLRQVHPSVQSISWADGLELIGDDDRLVGLAGALPLRLLAERTGLRSGLSGAMRRAGFDPVYDRGQVFLGLALMLILGGEAISDFQGLRHLAPGDRASTLNPDRLAGPRRGRRAAAGPGERGGDQVPAVLVGSAGRAPGGVSVVEGCRAGTDRGHGGRPGRHRGVRGVREGKREGHPQRRSRQVAAGTASES